MNWIIFWDFDGVLIDSDEIRERGFQLTLSGYSDEAVEQLLDFHRRNGGLSRYVKYRYFFESIMGESVSDAAVLELSARFSEIMRTNMVDSALLIPETISCIRRRHSEYEMHVVSGSDETELKYLCENLEIASYFRSINGSPTPKSTLLARLIARRSSPNTRYVMIGDSINDYDAARDNAIGFVAYNNDELSSLTDTKLPFRLDRRVRQ